MDKLPLILKFILDVLTLGSTYLLRKRKQKEDRK
jgi:hypothetical protein